MSDPKPILKRPPGYRDPNAPTPTTTTPTPTPKPAAPPSIRKSQIPPMYHPKPKRRNCCRCCCCFICSLLFILILLLAFAGALFYLWFEPKLPIFHLQSLKFSRFNVTVNTDGTFLDAQTAVRFEATNPNSKIEMIYDRTEVRLAVAGDVDIGSASIPGFTQGRKNITILKFGSEVKQMLIDDEVGTKLKNQIRSKELLVTVEVRTKVGVGLEGLKVGKLAVRVICENMNLNELEGGEMPKCTINLLKWINIH